MKILFINKRYNMGIDSLGKRHGRAFEFSEGLARLGYTVRTVFTDYHAAVTRGGFAPSTSFEAYVSPCTIGSFLKHFHVLKGHVEEFKPDLIIGGGDALNAVIASRLSMGGGSVPYAVDLKDNYLAFKLTRLPFLKRMFLNSLEKASGIFCVSASLKEWLMEQGIDAPSFVIENAVDTSLFYPRNKIASRERFGLPVHKFIIGTAGSLSKDRGIDELLKAFRILNSENPEINLAVAGIRDKNWKPDSKHTYDLGVLEQEEVPFFLSALDVGIVCNLESNFGSYCFPQKMYEMISCEIPVVAAKTRALSHLHKNKMPNAFYTPGDASSLGDVLREFVYSSVIEQKKIEPIGWDTQIRKLENIISLL